MKTVTKTIVALALLASSSFASAQAVEEGAAPAKTPAWLCAMNFTGTSKGVQLLIGFSEFKGAGTIVCKAHNGQRVSYPVTVTMKSHPLAPKISLGVMKLYGEALQIAISTGSPEDLLGNYLIASGRVAVVGGVGVITAVRASRNDLALKISLQLAKGLGFDLGFSKMNIELDPTRQP